MKKYTWIKLARFMIATLFSISAFTANAQNLPNIQKASARAPTNIKIDGKTTEWNNRFQAYNHATDIFYTLSNDDNKLYLTVQAANETIINKILLGGVSLIINPSDKKKDKNSVSITFPVFDRKDLPNMNLKNKPELTKDKARNRMLADSFMNVVNKSLTDKLKEIEITGVKEIPDSLISIYNEDGIKAAALFDNQISYTYELAIPLKYLGLSTDKFRYHIELNGASANHSTIQLSSGGRFYMVSSGGQTMAIPATSPQFTGMVFPTDFWGEYTLAKRL
jgi:hypothetical protein